MTGGPISDRRLVSCENDIVTFTARGQDKTKPKHQVPVKLCGVEFTRHWSLHILPKGFTKTRYFGGYSSGQRKAFLALCQQLHPQPPVATGTPPEVAEVEVQEAEASDSAPAAPNARGQ